MKKKNFERLFKIVGLITVMAFTALMLISCGQKTEDTVVQKKAAAIRWRLQSYAGPALNDHVVKNAIDSFNKAANEEMVIEVYTADQLVPHGELFNAVQAGTLEMAVSDDESIGSPADVAVFSGYFPAVARYGLDINALWNHYGLNEIWEESYGEVKGVTWLSQGSWDPCNIATTKPIRNVSDLKGLRLFTSLFTGRFLEEQYGVVPIVMPVEDIEMALQTGMLDGVTWSGITELYTIGWADKLKYLLTNPISGAWAGGWFVNTDAWEAIPPHMQELLRMAIDKSHYYRLHWYWWGEAKYRAHGDKFELTTIPESQWTSLEEQAAKYWDEFAKKSPRSARVIAAFGEYVDTMEKAGPPYRY